MRAPRRVLLLSLILGAMPALAQSDPPGTLPEWDRLTPAQREALVAPLQERWNSAPQQRARMLRHAQRWQSMTPEQRRAAHKGMRRFQGMDPQQRQQARALFERMKKLPPEQRRKLREEWIRMTPVQRRDWAQRHAPKEPAPVP